MQDLSVYAKQIGTKKLFTIMTVTDFIYLFCLCLYFFIKIDYNNELIDKYNVSIKFLFTFYILAFTILLTFNIYYFLKRKTLTYYNNIVFCIIKVISNLACIFGVLYFIWQISNQINQDLLFSLLFMLIFTSLVCFNCVVLKLCEPELLDMSIAFGNISVSQIQQPID